MKKINYKQPKYLLPAIIFFPLLFIGYQISALTGGTENQGYKPITDELNTSMPKAQDDSLKNKYDEMQDNYGKITDYTGVASVDKEDKRLDEDVTGNVYSQHEMDRIDSLNAMRSAQNARLKQMQKNIAAARQHINRYDRRGQGKYGNISPEMQQYAQDIDYIQQRARSVAEGGRTRSEARLRGGYNKNGEPEIGGEYNKDGVFVGSGSKDKKRNDKKAEIVTKAPDKNAGYFNTVGEKEGDGSLIKAMIDQTIKVQDGTRLRLKLLDDVTINKIKLKRGTYLYANITGFGAQRVMAKVSSILIGSKFIKVALSVYDNDGMEGFYVPQSAFRDLTKEAGAQALSQTFNMNSSTGEESMESFALQTLQNIYQSASQAVAKNIRKNKARIKYNTIVYLINEENN